MREIKFEAITREGKIVKEIGSIEFMTDGSIIVNDEIPVCGLREWTGLKDKNGKEIYEGDVLKWAFMIGEVAWVGEGFKWKRNLPKNFNTRKSFDHLPPDGVAKIIGNIHENPELLKETK